MEALSPSVSFMSENEKGDTSGGPSSFHDHKHTASLFFTELKQGRSLKICNLKHVLLPWIMWSVFWGVVMNFFSEITSGTEVELGKGPEKSCP